MSAIQTANPKRRQVDFSATKTMAALRSEWLISAVSITALSAAIIILGLYLGTALRWRNQPFIGAMFANPTLVVENIEPFSNETWAALENGIVAGDIIVGINGDMVDRPDIPIEDRHRLFQENLSALEVGDSARLSVISVDADQASVDVTLTRIPLVDFLLHFGVGFGTGLLTLLLGMFVLWQRPDMRSAKLFAISAAALSVVNAGKFDLLTTYDMPRVWLFASYVFVGATLSFAVTFPYDLRFVRRLPSARYGLLVMGVLAAVIAVGQYSVTGFDDALRLALIVLIASIAVVGGIMVWRRQYSTSPILREQATFWGVGTLLAFVPFTIWVGSVLISGRENSINELMPIMQITLILYAVSGTYALLQYRLLETDRIIPEAVVYGVLVGALLLGYGLLTVGIADFALDTIAVDNPLLVAAIIAAIVIGFNPVRNYLREAIDRTMFRQRRAYNTRSEAFSRALSDAVNMSDILQTVKNELNETVAPQHVFMFINDEKINHYAALPLPGKIRPETDITFAIDGGLVDFLIEEQSILYLEYGKPLPLQVARDRSQLGVLGVPLLLGLQARESLRGILAVGRRRNESNYDYEDLRYIENIADQVALAIERAQFVDDLERRVLVQDVLSQVSRALNYAIDFDTLLELIATQTQRIIPTDQFYIVLYDQPTDELYYSFYTVGDERLYDIETRHWKIGGGVISEVAVRQQPTRLSNFTEEQRRRDPNYRIGAPDIHGWMGVALITDTVGGDGGLLGVMAVGSTDPAVVFSDEQLRLLSDVASIAASAIDKTRLFEKTELRAAQLKALNDISGELASELEDVDRLLNNITEKAVQILGCEAGSLLLQDETGTDLVFRVVTGGSGQELLGAHIPLDSPSLVAEAVQRVQPIIVNDPLNDERWHGEVSDDMDETSFVSRYILTVPLVAQGLAVGALQVINKTDNTSFTDEDAILATTFAGQAAIAIQNARLFESQDQQLLARVEELEGMATIDHSLNQTLILGELVEIIMELALQQTEATSGAFFLLEDEPSQLLLLGSYGYPEGESVFDALKLGAAFPVKTGIMGRVVETGTPAYVSNVESDPHYLQSLPNCTAQIAVPLATGSEVRGVVLVETDNTENRLTLLDMSFLSRLMERANSAISNALLYSQLEAQQQARTEFVSFIAHELKTPITSMKGYTSLLIRGVVGDLNDQQSKFLNTVHSNVDQLEHLVNDIRDIEIIDARGELSMHMVSVQFSDVLRDSLQTVQQAIDEKGQEVVLDVPDDLPEIWADAQRLNQIMINFLTNANKYTQENGVVEVFAKPVNNRWDVRGARRVLHVMVKDNGLGISQEDLERLFEKYFRSTNDAALEQKGTGLGLTLTRRLIEQQGGKIWVESELGEGTAFNFTVPLASEVLVERV